MDFGETSIDKFGKSLLSQQRKEREKQRRKQERNELLGLAGSVGIGLYRNKLQKDREEFFRNSEIVGSEKKYQQGLDLYNNKIKRIYEEGTNSVGGLGNYLLENYATPEATKRINSRIDEDMVMNSDDLGSAVGSYARDMVYGENGMLKRLEAAYAAGSKLRSKEDYAAYVEKQADLPNSVAGGAFRALFSNKTPEEMDADAVRRVVDNNQFVQDSQAFITLSKAFDQGISLRDSEQIAKKVDQYTKNLEMKADEFLSDRQLVKRTRKVGNESQEWTYYINKYENRRTGEVRTVPVADTADPMSVKIFNDEEVTISGIGSPRKVINPLTGQQEEEITQTVTHISGEKLGTHIVERKVVDDLGDVDAATQTTEPLRQAMEERVNYLLETSDPTGTTRDSFTKYFEQLKGEGADSDKVKSILMGHANVIGFNIEKQYGLPSELAKNVASQIMIDNVVYRAEAGGSSGDTYQGANIVFDPQINGLRVLEALNTLSMTQPELNAGLTREGFNSLIGDLISNDNISRFTGRTGEIESKFNMNTRAYYIDKNQPLTRDDTRNLFNMKVSTVGIEDKDPDYTIMDLIRDRAGLNIPVPKDDEEQRKLTQMQRQLLRANPLGARSFGSTT